MILATVVALALGLGWGLSQLDKSGSVFLWKNMIDLPNGLLKNCSTWHDYHCVGTHRDMCDQKDECETRPNSFTEATKHWSVKDRARALMEVDRFVASNKLFTLVEQDCEVNLSCCSPDPEYQWGQVMAESVDCYLTIEISQRDSFLRLAVIRRYHCLAPPFVPLNSENLMSTSHNSSWPDHWHSWIVTPDMANRAVIPPKTTGFWTYNDPSWKAHVAYPYIKAVRRVFSVINVWSYTPEQIAIAVSRIESWDTDDDDNLPTVITSPCYEPHLSDHNCEPCAKAHLEDHECPRCTRNHYPLKPEVEKCARQHLDSHTCASCQLEHLAEHKCPPCTREHTSSTVKSIAVSCQVDDGMYAIIDGAHERLSSVDEFEAMKQKVDTQLKTANLKVKQLEATIASMKNLEQSAPGCAHPTTNGVYSIVEGVYTLLGDPKEVKAMTEDLLDKVETLTMKNQDLQTELETANQVANNRQLELDDARRMLSSQSSVTTSPKAGSSTQKPTKNQELSIKLNEQDFLAWDLAPEYRARDTLTLRLTYQSLAKALGKFYGEKYANADGAIYSGRALTVKIPDSQMTPDFRAFLGPFAEQPLAPMDNNWLVRVNELTPELYHAAKLYLPTGVWVRHTTLSRRWAFGIKV